MEPNTEQAYDEAQGDEEEEEEEKAEGGERLPRISCRFCFEPFNMDPTGCCQRTPVLAACCQRRLCKACASRLRPITQSHLTSASWAMYPTKFAHRISASRVDPA